VRLVFFGTPSDAVPALRAVAASHEVAFVVTQPDRRRGRGTTTSASPVKVAAQELGLEVRTPARATEVVDAVRTSNAELGVVVAFGQLLPDDLLHALARGFVNVHFSLLPRWRGAAPVERAILAGDTETGVCIMALDAGLDTGPVYARRSSAIGPRETAGELRARLVEIGTELLVDTLPRISEVIPEPQRGPALLAPKLTVEEFGLDWSHTADELDRIVRAGNPRPGAWTTVGDERLKVMRAEPWPAPGREPGAVDPHGVVTTGNGGLRLLEVQPEGRRAMTADAWLAGRHGEPTVLGR